jgi:hypothetical protein
MPTKEQKNCPSFIIIIISMLRYYTKKERLDYESWTIKLLTTTVSV